MTQMEYRARAHNSLSRRLVATVATVLIASFSEVASGRRRAAFKPEDVELQRPVEEGTRATRDRSRSPPSTSRVAAADESNGESAAASSSSSTSSPLYRPRASLASPGSNSRGGARQDHGGLDLSVLDQQYGSSGRGAGRQLYAAHSSRPSKHPPVPRGAPRALAPSADPASVATTTDLLLKKDFESEPDGDRLFANKDVVKHFFESLWNNFELSCKKSGRYSNNGCLKLGHHLLGFQYVQHSNPAALKVDDPVSTGKAKKSGSWVADPKVQHELVVEVLHRFLKRVEELGAISPTEEEGASGGASSSGSSSSSSSSSSLASSSGQQHQVLPGGERQLQLSVEQGGGAGPSSPEAVDLESGRGQHVIAASPATSSTSRVATGRPAREAERIREILKLLGSAADRSGGCVVSSTALCEWVTDDLEQLHLQVHREKEELRRLKECPVMGQSMHDAQVLDDLPYSTTGRPLRYVTNEGQDEELVVSWEGNGLYTGAEYPVTRTSTSFPDGTGAADLSASDRAELEQKQRLLRQALQLAVNDFFQERVHNFVWADAGRDAVNVAKSLAGWVCREFVTFGLINIVVQYGPGMTSADILAPGAAGATAAGVVSAVATARRAKASLSIVAALTYSTKAFWRPFADSWRLPGRLMETVSRWTFYFTLGQWFPGCQTGAGTALRWTASALSFGNAAARPMKPLLQRYTATAPLKKTLDEDAAQIYKVLNDVAPREPFQRRVLDNLLQWMTEREARQQLREAQEDGQVGSSTATRARALAARAASGDDDDGAFFAFQKVQESKEAFLDLYSTSLTIMPLAQLFLHWYSGSWESSFAVLHEDPEFHNTLLRAGILFALTSSAAKSGLANLVAALKPVLYQAFVSGKTTGSSGGRLPAEKGSNKVVQGDEKKEGSMTDKQKQFRTLVVVSAAAAAAVALYYTGSTLTAQCEGSWNYDAGLVPFAKTQTHVVDQSFCADGAQITLGSTPAQRLEWELGFCQRSSAFRRQTNEFLKKCREVQEGLQQQAQQAKGPQAQALGGQLQLLRGATSAPGSAASSAAQLAAAGGAAVSLTQTGRVAAQAEGLHPGGRQSGPSSSSSWGETLRHLVSREQKAEIGRSTEGVKDSLLEPLKKGGMSAVLQDDLNSWPAPQFGQEPAVSFSGATLHAPNQEYVGRGRERLCRYTDGGSKSSSSSFWHASIFSETSAAKRRRLQGMESILEAPRTQDVRIDSTSTDPKHLLPGRPQAFVETLFERNLEISTGEAKDLQSLVEGMAKAVRLSQLRMAVAVDALFERDEINQRCESIKFHSALAEQQYKMWLADVQNVQRVVLQMAKGVLRPSEWLSGPGHAVSFLSAGFSREAIAPLDQYIVDGTTFQKFLGYFRFLTGMKAEEISPILPSVSAV
ncbi:unnamed protein product [Amoebophrya sp. A120]|nr:unnamed protein product [Amoebophrya sp. A120]|eukprot:GSA120T00000694001.1